MRYYQAFLFLSLIFAVGCQSTEQEERQIDIQGHRGARGLLPENSIRGFIKAIDLGVNTLEFDLCVTGDKKLVVSHEPFFSHEICLDEQRNMIKEDSARGLNIYQMNYEEVRQFDCGSLMHTRFPSQGKVKVVKPLLADVFSRTERYLTQNNLEPVAYNIELKSQESTDNLFHPEPAEFSDLVFKAIDGRIDWSRVTIQSFDFRILRYFQKTYPDVRLSQLIENDKSWKENVAELGFAPDVYSCYYESLTKEDIAALHKKDIQVIPWTINEVKDMERLIDWGVDGIITDYPDRVKELSI